MTPKQQAIEDMIFVGQQMSNLCYNLRQNPQLAERPANIEAMKRMHNQFDAALCAYRKLTAKAKARP